MTSPTEASHPGRVGLLGAESTGKTTLADALARSIDALVAEEYLRDFVRDFKRLPTVADQEGILLTQQATVATVARAAAHARVPWIIADPLPLMTAVYSVVYFADHSLIDPGIADARDYDLLLWCTPDFPGEPEPGMRDGQERRAETERVIAEVIAPRLRDSGVRVVRLTGDAQARLAVVRTAMSA